MELECSRYPGASTIGSQLLDEIAPMASKSWQPSHEPPHRREQGHLSHWYNIYCGIKRGYGGNNPAMLEGRRLLQRMHEASMCIWTTEDHWLHKLTVLMLAPSMHWCMCMIEHSRTLGNTDPWQMHWCKCLTKCHWGQGNTDIWECTGACA